jgi:hypothetical protein
MPHSYYSVALSHHWRLIVLDTTEMSLHSGYPEVSHRYDRYSWRVDDRQ